MTAPGDQDAMFKRMFGSFIARRNRGSSSHHPPPRPDPLPRSSSSRSKSRGISALLSSSGAQSPAHRSYQSSSSHRNNSFAAAAAAAAAAAGFPSAPYGQPQYRQSTAQYNPPSRHDQERMSFGSGQGSGGRSGRGPLPSMLPGTPGAGRSRRQSGKPSDNNSSTDGRPQKRIRTGEQSSAGTMARSHSAKMLGRSSSTRKLPVEEQSSARAFVRSQSAKSLSGSAALLPCDECDSKFKQQGQLNRHFKRVHLGIRHHKCEVCKKMFASRSDRDRHEEKLHKKPRHFPCAHCNFESLTKKHLREHLLAVHPENRSVVLPRKRSVHYKAR